MNKVIGCENLIHCDFLKKDTCFQVASNENIITQLLNFENRKYQHQPSEYQKFEKENFH